ncbi:MAG: YiiX/YebB-like N1pC/P60 family cysteine hydrolase [Bacteroidota bacterium]|nr:YiiX/YebB-like N1pC/P60 family cysteine hydrolase [Bacteroidota bacterium]
MSYKLSIAVIFLSFAGLFACTQPEPKIQLQSGDILFRGATSGKISEAIDKVTQTSGETHFSHVGLVENSDTGMVVLHASPDGGTCVVSLDEFLHPEGDSVMVVAYRLKAEWQKAIPAALTKAKQLKGKPYNFSYILSDTAHYCSEFVYLAFAADSVFVLEPMTFKDPKTNEFFPTWMEYYQKMGLEIPEGQPGCNPNGMAASYKLERIGKIN